MYPTLFHAVKDLIGLEIPFLKLLNSFGFFVVLAFMAAAYTLSLELKRMHSEGIMKPVRRKVQRGKDPGLMAYLGSGLMGFLLGFKFIHVLIEGGSILSDPPAYLFSTQGSWFGGILLGSLFVWLRYREWQKEKQTFPEPKEIEHIVTPREHANSLAIQAAIWGFLGAKLFFIFEDPAHIKTFFTNFSMDSILSGLTVYGGLILGTIGVFLYFRKNGIPPLAGVDAVAPGFLLAYGVGRIGCQVAGDGDWGVNNTAPKPDWMSWLPDWLWSYDYPNNVNRVGEPLPEGATIFEGYGTHLVPSVWPTPIYETLMAIILFTILWSLRKKLKPLGAIFFLTFAFNGIERWFIEKVRVNEKIDVASMSLTQAEYISVFITLIGIAGLIWVYVRHNKKSEELIDA